jgi:hypothetical protein
MVALRRYVAQSRGLRYKEEVPADRMAEWERVVWSHSDGDKLDEIDQRIEDAITGLSTSLRQYVST